MKKRILVVLLCLIGLSVVLVQSSEAVVVNTTVTADNHYALFYGDETGMTLVGRNEYGKWHDDRTDTRAFNWTHPESWEFEMDAGDDIYIAAWSDDIVAQGVLGEFRVSGDGLDTSILTGTDWEYLLTRDDRDTGDEAPSTDQMVAYIANGVWNDVTFTLPHTSSPWNRSFPGISATADWMWGSALRGGSAFGETQLFRITVGEAAPVPEPVSVALFGIGLVGLARFKRKK